MSDGWPLYRRVLGEAWHALPAAVQRMHEADVSAAEGVAQAERGDHPLAGLIAGLLGLPSAGRDLPLRVTFGREGGAEIWRRTFAERSFTSRQHAGEGADAGLKIEHFGPITLILAMQIDGERLRLAVRGWRVLGLPMPRSLAPSIDTYEAEADGRFVFDDDIRHPLVGRIARCRGWLEPVAELPPQPST